MLFWLIGDLTIFTSNFDDHAVQVFESHFFLIICIWLKGILSVFPSCLIKIYTFRDSISISTLFLQVFSWNFMKNAQHMMCHAHGEGSMWTENISKYKPIIHHSDGTMISPPNFYQFPALLRRPHWLLAISHHCRYLCHVCVTWESCQWLDSVFCRALCFPHHFGPPKIVVCFL